MSVQTPLLRGFPHTVQLAPFTGLDADLKPSYGPDVAYTARVEDSQTIIRTPDSQEVASPRKVFLDTSTIPSSKDRVTLPSGLTPAQPPILKVQPVHHQTGVHHVVLYLS